MLHDCILIDLLIRRSCLIQKLIEKKAPPSNEEKKEKEDNHIIFQRNK